MSIAYDLPTATKLDPAELNDWYASLDSVAARSNSVCIPELLSALQSRSKSYGTGIPSPITTPYVNTIPVDQQAAYPGDLPLEKRVRNLIRWNAMLWRSIATMLCIRIGQNAKAISKRCLME
ncbi:Pyruvate dehydrogenase E1 component [Novipirellula aureliae]|uniref:Pyruvate dehydrogenase E1 component n=1 Tax=Novipirellula aureliae TaxID=2527966 RepID=A0A5C6EE75_9BACT|nr:hypothetical protein [Novipirellula aureliae]TWU45846.1 Pyruvate dehydrogenase E1 component [Novipirellula aureliae]